MNKKGFYLTVMPLEKINDDSQGVGKKIRAQVQFLCNAGIETEILSLGSAKQGIIKRMLSKITPSFYFKLLPYDFFSRDFYYIRNFGELSLLKILKKLKQGVVKQKQNIIIIEVPSFTANTNMFKTLGQKINHLLEIYTHNRYKKYVDAIATHINYKTLFGIKTIRISVGIDCSRIPVRLPALKNNPCAINLLEIAAKYTFWTGCDRVIEGLSAYYKDSNRSQKVIIHIVGGGGTDELKSLVKKYGLEDYVIFYGSLSGGKLDQVYDLVDLGIGSLGLHRRDIHESTDLKSREYLARGLPIVASEKVDVLPDNFEYCFYVPADDSPVDIQSIVDYYLQLRSKRPVSEIIKETRSFAEEFCDISRTMKPVVEYINCYER